MKDYSTQKFEELAKKAIKMSFGIWDDNTIAYGDSCRLIENIKEKKELANFIRQILKEERSA